MFWLEHRKIGSNLGEITSRNSLEVYKIRNVFDYRTIKYPHIGLEIEFCSLDRSNSIKKLYPLTSVADLWPPAKENLFSDPSQVVLKKGDIVFIDGLGLTPSEMKELCI